MDIMEILNVVVTGLVVVLLALVMIMFVTMIVGKVLAFFETFGKISKAQKEAKKAEAAK